MKASQFKSEFVCITRDMQHIVRDTMVPLCQHHGLTLQQLYVLMELDAEPDQTSSQLSDRVGILRTNFAQVCHKMKADGLLEQRRSESDRRSVKLHITDKGRAVLAAIDTNFEAMYGPRFASEPEATFDTIIDAMQTLRGFLAKLD